MKTRRRHGGFKSSTGLTLRTPINTKTTNNPLYNNPLYNPSKLASAELTTITVPETSGQYVTASNAARNSIHSASSTGSHGSISSVTSNPFTKGKTNYKPLNKVYYKQPENLTSSRTSTEIITSGANSSSANSSSANSSSANSSSANSSSANSGDTLFKYSTIPSTINNTKTKHMPRKIQKGPRGGKRSSKTRKQRKQRK